MSIMETEAARTFAEVLRELHVPSASFAEMQRALEQSAVLIVKLADEVDDWRRKTADMTWAGEDFCGECGYYYDDLEEGCDDCVDQKVVPQAPQLTLVKSDRLGDPEE